MCALAFVDGAEAGKLDSFQLIPAAETNSLLTNDIFDIQLSTAQDDIVWTVAQGRLIVLEDVTD